jgi:hypothetical protein
MARASPPLRQSFRYGPICLIALGIVLFAIAAREGQLTRAIVVGLAGAALAIAAVTSSLKAAERRRAGAAAAGLLAAVTVLTALDVLSPGEASAAAGAFATATVVTIVGGLLRLIRERGVTVQAVAGGLAIYALIGLVFAFAIDVAARAGSHAFFASGSDGNLSDHVYYSFTVLTTTGFGDFAPATRPSRMLATGEMLFGQIYLVTVVALLVSNVRRREQ